MSTTVYSGAAAPEDLRFEVEQGASGVDLTTVTAVSLRVRLPDGNVVTWAAAIAGGATATKLTAVHVWAVDETEQLGTYVAYVVMTLPGGTWRSTPRTFEVVDPLNPCGGC